MTGGAEMQTLDPDLAVRTLKRDGIFVVERYLTDEALGRLSREFELLFDRRLDGVSPEDHPPGRSVRIRSSQARRDAIPGILEIFLSDGFREVSQRYLPSGSEFNLEIVATHETKTIPITNTHFDNLRSLKFMIYLMDTDEANGAFRYAKGTQSANERFRRHYLICGGRLDDLPNIAGEDEGVWPQPICAPAGSLLIFDTEGFHSGGCLTMGRERKVMRARSLYSGQPIGYPSRFSLERLRRSRFNPLRMLAPSFPPSRKATRGRARAD
jgi:hypothetical protein